MEYQKKKPICQRYQFHMLEKKNNAANQRDIFFATDTTRRLCISLHLHLYYIFVGSFCYDRARMLLSAYNLFLTDVGFMFNWFVRSAVTFFN